MGHGADLNRLLFGAGLSVVHAECGPYTAGSGKIEIWKKTGCDQYQ